MSLHYSYVHEGHDMQTVKRANGSIMTKKFVSTSGPDATSGFCLYLGARFEVDLQEDGTWVERPGTFRPRMGRPSQRRTVRLQAAITPEQMAWLEEQRIGRGEKSVSDVVFKLLEKERNAMSGFHPTQETIDAWADSMLNEATDDMQKQDLEITPFTLSAFFEKEYELPFTPEEAQGWLSQQDWYNK